MRAFACALLCATLASGQETGGGAVENCHQTADIVFVVDESGSTCGDDQNGETWFQQQYARYGLRTCTALLNAHNIRPQPDGLIPIDGERLTKYMAQRKLIRDISQGFDMGTHANEARMAMVGFANNGNAPATFNGARIIHPFPTSSGPTHGDHADLHAAFEAAVGQTRSAGGTYVGRGITMATQMLRDHGRPNARKIIVVLLDGTPHGSYRNEANAAQEIATVIGVGYDLGADVPVLTAISTPGPTGNANKWVFANRDISVIANAFHAPHFCNLVGGSGHTLTMTSTTCTNEHARTHYTGITGTFTEACGGENGGAACTSQTVGAHQAGEVDTHTYRVTSDLSSGPGCFKIDTTHHDGWKICRIQVSSDTGGAHGLGGSWAWQGEQWIDQPCVGNYGGAGCTNSFKICNYGGGGTGGASWAAVHNTAAPVTAAPEATCTVVVRQHYGHHGTTQTYVGPMTGPLHAATGQQHGQASGYQITGTPGCKVTMYCHAGSACWYHGNSQCRNSAAGCADANGNWEETYIVPASGSLSGIIQHNDPRNAYINIQPNPGAAPHTVSGDPFTTDASGNKVQFFLPLQQEQHLLTCDSMQLYGRAMESGVAGDHQQWFDMFRVINAGEEIIKVESSKERVIGKVSDDEIDVTRVNATGKKAVEMTPLTTMSVQVMKQNMKKTGGVAYNGFEMSVSQDAAKAIGKGYSEMVDVVVGAQRLQFSSAAASKYADKADQALYAHLDLRFANLDTSKCSAGILAEIWGLKEMSAATTAMLHPADTA